MNVSLWLGLPVVRLATDALTGRPQGNENPHFMNGVQELLVYFDPWLARSVFPLVYTLGFVAIAFLFEPTPEPDGTHGSRAPGVLLAIILIALEAVWLFLAPMFARALSHGSGYAKACICAILLAQGFFVLVVPPMLVAVLAGLMAATSYVVLRLCGLWHRPRRAEPFMAYWRSLLLILTVQVAALVPIKMLLLWTFSVKYIIDTPEFFLNV